MQMAEHIKAIDAAVQAIAEAQLQGNHLSSEEKAKVKALAEQLFVEAQGFHDPVQVHVSLLSGRTLFEEEMSGALKILDVKKKVVSLLPQPQRRHLSFTQQGAGETAVLDDAMSLRGLACEGNVRLEITIHARVVLEEFRAALLVATGIDANDEDFSRDDWLLEIGVNSSQLLEFTSRMQGSFPGLKLPATLVFDHPSATEICDFIDSEYPWSLTLDGETA